MKSRKKILTKNFCLAVIVVLILTIISLLTGVYDIGSDPHGMEMFFITRIPRTISLLLTGAAMAMSGVVLQLITQNKLVEPTTMGTIEWAGLGLLFSYALNPFPSLFLRMTFAIIFSFIGTVVFFLFINKIKLKTSLGVPIIGMMLGAVVSATTTFLGLALQMSQVLESWFVGSFSSVQIGRYEYLWGIAIISIIIFIFADKLTLSGLGKDVTKSLGGNYNLIIIIGVAITSLLTGIVAAVIGNLPFLGLIVPNIVSMYRGDDLKSNLPWIMVLGSGIIMACDIVSRSLISPFEVPVSLILGSFGALCFIIIILKQRKRTW